MYISSAFRGSGTSSKFNITLPAAIECSGETHVAITSVILPMSLYNVQTGVSDKLYIFQKDVSGQSNVITLAAGQYSATSLAVAIQQGLTAVALGSAGYTCNFSSTTSRLTIQQTGGSGFVILDDYTLINLGTLNSSGFYYGNLITNPQSLGAILNLPPAASPNVVLTTGFMTMSPITDVYIRSNIANSTLDCLGRRDIACRIPVTSAFGTVIVSRSNVETSDYMTLTGGPPLKNLTFEVTDLHGNGLSFHGLDISFTLSFVYGPLE